jgi:hypothetical protein
VYAEGLPAVQAAGSAKKGERAQAPPAFGPGGDGGELVVEVGLVESNHAARKLIKAAMKCVQIRDLKDDEVVRRAAVLESPVDERMSDLCGS